MIPLVLFVTLSQVKPFFSIGFIGVDFIKHMLSNQVKRVQFGFDIHRLKHSSFNDDSLAKYFPGNRQFSVQLSWFEILFAIDKLYGRMLESNRVFRKLKNNVLTYQIIDIKIKVVLISLIFSYLFNLHVH